MLLASKILAGLVLLIHIYIVLLETVLFKTRGRRVFGLSADKAAIVAPLMFNQGCYNGFLAGALALGLLLPDGRAFTVFGLVCVALAGVVGAATVQMRILYVQTVPAVAALVTLYLA